MLLSRSPYTVSTLSSESASASQSGPHTWKGWLTAATLRVPDPASALTYWAELLGGKVDNGAIALGSSTLLRVAEGEPGLETATLVLAQDAGEGSSDAVDQGISRDPDGRELLIEGTPEVSERPPSSEPRLGHLTFMSPDPVGVQSHYERLGFSLSEGLAEFFRWLRCNPIHHTVAFSRAEVPRLHHVGIELPDRAALIDACDRLRETGHVLEYGPGRHMVGNNIFVYFRDRHGIRFEFFCELRSIPDPDEKGVVHTEIPRDQSINVWGPQPPPTFAEGT